MPRRKLVVQMTALVDVVPNRYRNMERYHISESKIETLIQSFENSDFWDGSIQGREHPTKPGKIEIAFGHHRIEAARRWGRKEVGIVVGKRSNEQMLLMMADENDEEFKHDALVSIETIGTVIEAYARGEIALPPVPADTNKAYIHALPAGRAYTLTTVARFLRRVKPSTGEPKQSCREAFDAYHERRATAEALKTLPSDERSSVAVKTVVTAAKAARHAAEKQSLKPAQVERAAQLAAKNAVKEVQATSGFKARDVAQGIGRAAAATVAGKHAKPVPMIEVYTTRLIDACGSANPFGPLLLECSRLLPFVERGELDHALAVKLADALEHLLTRQTKYVEPIIRMLKAGKKAQLVSALQQLQQAGH